MSNILLPKAYLSVFREVEDGLELDLQDAETRETFFTLPEVFKTEQDGVESLKKWLETMTPAGWDGVRNVRNLKLAQSDWTQLADAPLSPEQKSAWAAYRQALRDLLSSFTSLEDIVWPEAPQ